MTSICTQNFISKFASLKIEHLMLGIPLNAIENGIIVVKHSNDK